MFDADALLSRCRFRLLEPSDGPAPDGLYRLARASGKPVRLLRIPEAPFDVLNTELPASSNENGWHEALQRLCAMPKMSTLAIGAMINRIVHGIPAGQSFVNVGVWNGF